MKNKLTKLVIRVIQPPISIFEIGSGKAIERTYAYESAFANSEHYFFMVPDGRYKVLQGELVCCYDVKGGKVSEVEVEVKPKETKETKTKDVKEVVKGVTLDDVVASEKKKDKKDKNSVTGIM